MIDKQLIERKLRRIEELLRELSLVRVESVQEFKSAIVSKRFIERNIELAIEQMIDVCKHLVSGLDLKEPETYAECFDLLVQKGIVDKGNLDTFRAMVRFRNFLIHAYEGVDDSVTYSIYEQKLNDFSLFVSEIRTYLGRP